MPARKSPNDLWCCYARASKGRFSLYEKNRWGFDKSRLDICFMAHKYTTYGQDKGYNVFVSVATILRQYHEDIYFHVVGPFDPKVIDVSSLK